MNPLTSINDLLPLLTQAEKAMVLKNLAEGIENSFPGIDINPHVCGGEPCMVRTRIPVWVLVRATQLGISEADILKCYPVLRAQDLVQGWSYYGAHRGEIDRQILENETA